MDAWYEVTSTQIGTCLANGFVYPTQSAVQNIVFIRPRWWAEISRIIRGFLLRNQDVLINVFLASGICGPGIV